MTNNNFDFIKSDIYKTVRAKKFVNSLGVRIIRFFLYTSDIILLSFLATNYFYNNLTPIEINLIIFYSSIVLMIFMADLFINIHYSQQQDSKLNEIIKKNNINLAEYFAVDSTAQIIAQAIKIAKKNKLPQINSNLIFLAFDKNDIGFEMLLRAQIYINNDLEQQIIKDYQQNIKPDSRDMFSAECLKIFNLALDEAIINNHSAINASDLLTALYKNNQAVKSIFDKQSLKLEDVINISTWVENLFSGFKKQYFWQKNYYGKGVGQDWASGFTPTLNYFSRDISEYLADAKLQSIAQSHRNVLGEIENGLVRKDKNNVILVGEAGVGKRTVVNAFAQKVARGQVNMQLRYKHIIELDINRILSGVAKPELETRFKTILDEISSAGNIILFINNLENLVSSDMEQLGTIDATEFLVPFLESDKMHIITTASFEGWHKKIQSNQAFANLFTKIDIIEPKQEEMLSLLQDAVLPIELKNNLIFAYSALKKIIELSDRYIHDEVFPQKAIDVAEAISINRYDSDKTKLITEIEVQTYIANKYKVPASDADKNEKEKLINLENQLHERIVDQEEAINAISNAMRRARVGLAKRGKPIGSFLFVGPTGVGKTETTKALTEIFFSSQKSMIRFDMSEYQQISSIERLIGAENARGKSEQGLLSVALRENPYCVVLFDEIEKAHPNILNLFLQMLDEGNITDSTGRKVDFSNAIIIATSNAGAEEIRQYIKNNKPLDKLSAYILDFLQKGGIFRPEFLNRFDAVVCFKPLLPEHILAIAKMMIDNLGKVLNQKDITLQISEPAVQKLANLGYDPTLGARPMARVIQDKVENLIADRLLTDKVKKGQTVMIEEKDIE